MKSPKRLAWALALIMLLVAICPKREHFVVSATSTRQQIDKTTQEKNELEGVLDDINDNLEDLKDTRHSLKGELNSLNEQLTELSAKLEELEGEITTTEGEITQTQAALEEAKATEQWQYESMVIRVRAMYEQNDTSYLNAILTAGSLAEMLNVADYFEKVAAYDKQMLNEYKENRKLIEEQEEKLQSERARLENLKIAAEAEKNKVAGLISQTSNAIAKYSDQISEEEKRALEYEAEIAKKEEDLTYLKKKLAEEMAMSQTALNSTWRDISEVNFAEGDKYLLANLIYCEAGGEPYAGQLAVGSVVINRVLSSVYPDTVVGVIYQNKQFSPVASGRLELALGANKATASCYQAAEEAMSGITNVGQCVYFRTPVEGLTGISIGGHIFY